MLTGSLALTFYTTPRMTRDIDLVVEISAKDIERVVQGFELQFYIDQNAVIQAVQDEGMFNLLHNEFHVKVDLIIRKADKFRQTEFQRRKSFSLMGTKVWVVSPEDLILSKLYWAKESRSEMQIRDICSLLKSVKDLDIIYMKKWLDQLGVRSLFDEITL